MSIQPPPSRFGPIDLVTIVVPELDHAEEAWSGGLGMQLIARGTCSDALALALGRRDLVDARHIGLGRAGQPQLRLIEALGNAPATPLSRPGWQAISLQLADLDATLNQAAKAGFQPLSVTADHPSGPWMRTARVVGSAGEVVCLAQRRPSEAVQEDDAALCMVITASRQADQASGFYEGLGAGERRLLDAEYAGCGNVQQDDAGNAQPSTLLHLAGGHLIQITAWPTGQTVPPVAECGLLSVRFGRAGRPRGAESQLSQSFRVLGGPEGELIELL